MAARIVVSEYETRKGFQSGNMTAMLRQVNSGGMKGVAASQLKDAMALRLRVAREALGLRSGDVARQLGKPESSYSRYETGVSGIPLKVIADLDRFYGITPSYLISGKLLDLPRTLADALERMASARRLRIHD